MVQPESPEELISRVRGGETIEFEEAIQVIENWYQIRRVGFSNGLGEETVVSEPGANMGSLKILGFAKMHGLTESETLPLFGKFYREDVLLNPESKNHPNIRAFMKYGWSGVRFDGPPIEAL